MSFQFGAPAVGEGRAGRDVAVERADQDPAEAEVHVLVPVLAQVGRPGRDLGLHEAVVRGGALDVEVEPRAVGHQVPERDLVHVRALRPVLRQVAGDRGVVRDVLRVQQACHRDRGDELAAARDVHTDIGRPALAAVDGTLRPLPLQRVDRGAVPAEPHHVTVDRALQGGVECLAESVDVEVVRRLAEEAGLFARRVVVEPAARADADDVRRPEIVRAERPLVDRDVAHARERDGRLNLGHRALLVVMRRLRVGAEALPLESTEGRTLIRRAGSGHPA